MREFTRHQKKIIDRYYEHRDDIMLTKLSELATELYLAETDKKRDQLWKRVETAMKTLKVKETIASKIMAERRPDALAKHVKEWLANPPK